MAIKFPKLKIKSYHSIVIITALFFLMSLISVYSFTGEIIEHLIYIIVGSIAIWALSRISYTRLNKYSVLFLLIAFLLLVYTLVFGTGAAGRSIVILNRYIQTFYPIAFLVIFFIVNFLAIRVKNEHPISRNEAIVLFSILLLFCGGIAFRNMSTALLLFATAWIVMYIAEIKIKYLINLLLICIVAGSLYIGYGALSEKKATEKETVEDSKDRGSTVANRIKYWITGESDTKGYGKQMTLAKAAIARSGLTPAGPGKGIIKKNMAEGENDFIFALICEEFGAIIGGLILFLYMSFFAITIRIAKKSNGAFAKLYTIGIGFLIAGQGLVHIGANLGVIPATGQTLPFISKGGISLLISCIAVGILINIAKRVGEDEPIDEE